MSLIGEIKDLVELLIIAAIIYLAWKYFPWIRRFGASVWAWLQRQLSPIAEAAQQAAQAARRAVTAAEKGAARAAIGALGYGEEAGEAVETIYPVVSTAMESTAEVARSYGVPYPPLSTEIAKTLGSIIAGMQYAEYLRRKRIAARISVPVTYYRWLYLLGARLTQIGGYPRRLIQIPAEVRINRTRTIYIT